MLLDIKRVLSKDDGTFGVIYAPGIALFSLELPWRQNKTDYSCIPAGLYEAKQDISTLKGNKHVIRLFDVPNRSNVLIHVGNYAGDSTLGYKTDVQGCIIPGTGFSFVSFQEKQQRLVTNSRIAMQDLLDIVKEEYLTITIEDVMEVDTHV